jgi:hypothetical protein
MIVTLIVVMTCMLFDRIFYNIQAFISKESMIQKLNLEQVAQSQAQPLRSARQGVESDPNRSVAQIDQ